MTDSSSDVLHIVSASKVKQHQHFPNMILFHFDSNSSDCEQLFSSVQCGNQQPLFCTVGVVSDDDTGLPDEIELRFVCRGVDEDLLIPYIELYSVINPSSDLMEFRHIQNWTESHLVEDCCMFTHTYIIPLSHSA